MWHLFNVYNILIKYTLRLILVYDKPFFISQARSMATLDRLSAVPVAQTRPSAI